ncbi:uncharacterized protein BX663DRAFT_497162 [Cokeromyces recurvatus]|uniref:uncharacterized protein n=1 Tax=Cokeromyces recurvatus TaxID=90255 RepID=UPI0022210E76|nr:uncharacterized protein BX663DRAFT_497162 [Cokeromyces recurvatus]KAI7906637.1 hypothetical protein BX663DRAFT_497162 [Cokeromyces recurvatus]
MQLKRYFVMNKSYTYSNRLTKNDVSDLNKHFYHLKSKSCVFRSLSFNLELGTARGISTSSVLFNRDYEAVLSAALDQSKISTAQLLFDKIVILIRKGSPELAWECYIDLKQRKAHQFIFNNQYRQLIKLFTHSKSSNEQSLEYILSLVEDMKQLGYQVGQREKLLMMRLLGRNGKIEAMESVFQDLIKDLRLIIPNSPMAQKPFNVVLASYQLYEKDIGSEVVARKSMDLYKKMLDLNMQPGQNITFILMDNIRSAGFSDDMVEEVWDWVWTKIGMNVGGKTKVLDPILYKEMIIYFTSVGRPEYALEINDIMVKKKIPRSLRMLTALIHKVGRAGNVERSMELFNEMVNIDKITPSLVTYNALIDVYAHKKPDASVKDAHKVYDMLNEAGLKPDSITFSILIDMYAKQGDLTNVRRLIDTMVKTYNFEPNEYVLSSLIECFIKLHDHESVMEFLPLLKKQALRRAAVARQAYNLIIKGLIQDDYILEAVELLDYMSKNMIHLEPRTFTPLLAYYARQGDVLNTHKVASMMSQANVKPNSHTYSILMEAYAKAGDIEGTENIFKLCKTQFRPNTYIYNALLYVYAKRNEMDKVLETYKHMSNANVPANEFTYGILMNFYSRRKDVKAVEALMSTMSNNVTPKTVSWTILMQTYFENDRPEDGRDALKRMIDAGVEPSIISWGILIKGCVDANELEYAESTLQGIIKRSKVEYILDEHNLLRDKCFGSTRTYIKTIPDTIEDILNKARKPIKRNTALSSFLFTPLMEAYMNDGRYSKAKNLFNTMINLSVPVSVPAYTILMNLFKHENRFEAVETLWKLLYNRTPDKDFIEGLDPLLPRIPLPKQNYDYSNLLFLDHDAESIETAKPIPIQATPFALSIYLDTLIEQDRYTDIEDLWNQLTQDEYCFDEQNWNRYIYALLLNGELKKACETAYRQFLEDKPKGSKGSGQAFSIVRKRDKIDIANEYGLHLRTCITFAEVFKIRGTEHMNDHQLKSVVFKKIERYIQDK